MHFDMLIYTYSSIFLFLCSTYEICFLLVDFSAESWFENNGLGHISPLDDLWGDAVKFLSEVIGLDKYFLDEPCDLHNDPYRKSIESWNNG